MPSGKACRTLGPAFELNNIKSGLILPFVKGYISDRITGFPRHRITGTMVAHYDALSTNTGALVEALLAVATSG